jgi:hypothetical protein
LDDGAADRRADRSKRLASLRKRFIAYGVEAVPHLLKWVMHDELAIRYVAAYSLEQLTGIQGEFGWFDKDDVRHGREAAIARWKQWWDSRAD